MKLWQIPILLRHILQLSILQKEIDVVNQRTCFLKGTGARKVQKDMWWSWMSSDWDEEICSCFKQSRKKIQELKVETRKDIRLDGPWATICFMVICIRYQPKIFASCARITCNLDSDVSRTFMSGQLTDILHVCNF